MYNILFVFKTSNNMCPSLLCPPKCALYNVKILSQGNNVFLQRERIKSIRKITYQKHWIKILVRHHYFKNIVFKYK